MNVLMLWPKISCNVGDVSLAKTVKNKIGKNTFNVTAKDLEISYVATRKAIMGLEENGLLVHRCGDKCLSCELLKLVKHPSAFNNKEV